MAEMRGEVMHMQVGVPRQRLRDGLHLEVVGVYAWGGRILSRTRRVLAEPWRSSSMQIGSLEPVWSIRSSLRPFPQGHFEGRLPEYTPQTWKRISRGTSALLGVNSHEFQESSWASRFFTLYRPNARALESGRLSSIKTCRLILLTAFDLVSARRASP